MHSSVEAIHGREQQMDGKFNSRVWNSAFVHGQEVFGSCHFCEDCFQCAAVKIILSELCAEVGYLGLQEHVQESGQEDYLRLEL